MEHEQTLDYPGDAAMVRDMIKEQMRSQVDFESAMDTGGGMGSADLWLSIDGVEYFISVRPATPTPARQKAPE